MYSSFQIAARFLRYFVSASNGKGHGMHSPFVFDFIRNVLRNKKGVFPPEAIESLRTALKKDRRSIVVEDLGAGSRIHQSRERMIGEIARTSVKSRKYSHLLYRAACHYQPQTIVELGTSLGISTATIAAANPHSKIFTIEGSAAVHAQAKENFRALHLQNIRALQGSFDAVLPDLLPSIPRIDLAFIDGNHRYEPTLKYFRQLLEKCGPASILIFDDIHWSREMEAAWKEIQRHPEVRCTIDLFFPGFVFLNPAFKTKQHFRVRY
jgi:predicted O-methyltransferase YrrM